MCGLRASNVREELVSVAVREAGQDFVYGGYKATGLVRFYVALSVDLLVGSEAPVAT